MQSVCNLPVKALNCMILTAFCQTLLPQPSSISTWVEEKTHGIKDHIAFSAMVFWSWCRQISPKFEQCFSAVTTSTMDDNVANKNQDPTLQGLEKDIETLRGDIVAKKAEVSEIKKNLDQKKRGGGKFQAKQTALEKAMWILKDRFNTLKGKPTCSTAGPADSSVTNADPDLHATGMQQNEKEIDNATDQPTHGESERGDHEEGEDHAPSDSARESAHKIQAAERQAGSERQECADEGPETTNQDHVDQWSHFPDRESVQPATESPPVQPVQKETIHQPPDSVGLMATTSEQSPGQLEANEHAMLEEQLEKTKAELLKLKEEVGKNKKRAKEVDSDDKMGGKCKKAKKAKANKEASSCRKDEPIKGSNSKKHITCHLIISAVEILHKINEKDGEDKEVFGWDETNHSRGVSSSGENSPKEGLTDNSDTNSSIGSQSDSDF
ncbi:hypothetical protein SERLA73DRAFT_155679 [Serpula lacrymans var. lacrymans S7.3]|uniref:Uncharacterized protein n=2 Tax=Serpula lacrymans var. lacrymans TaxID=341189 RepID=F8QAY0_SERL3|nr:hypothetical protein SERLA73DRAFT_155679 [Serpula lacrymans var. lacrymans S7.3]